MHAYYSPRLSHRRQTINIPVGSSNAPCTAVAILRSNAISRVRPDGLYKREAAVSDQERACAVPALVAQNSMRSHLQQTAHIEQRRPVRFQLQAWIQLLHAIWSLPQANFGICPMGLGGGGAPLAI
jgi:hypothetical protein